MSKNKGSGHASPKIDPFLFMEMDKTDIFYQLTSELGYAEEEARREFDSMTAMLTRLKSMRSCQPQTDDYLKDAVPQLHRGVKILTVTILLNATKADDTYCHAYNTFVYYSNRYLRNNFPRKVISDHQLLMLLAMEKKEKNLDIPINKSQPAEDQTKPPLFDSAECDKVLSEIRNSENKFWKGLPMKKVVDHFVIMTTRKNKNGEPYLTGEQLISFLKRGFLLDSAQPVQKINCTFNEKGFVIKRFYQLYDLAAAQYGYPAKKTRFIDLFTDCFDNWDESSVITFFKPNKVKENW